MISALLASVALWLAFPAPAPRPRAITGGRAPLLPVALLGAVMIGLAIGGMVGLVVAIGVCVALPRFISALSTRNAEHERRERERDLPNVAALLAALLASGATIHASMSALAGAHRGPLQLALVRVDAAMRLGASPDDAWQAGADVLEPIARALGRSARSGAPAATLLNDVVGDAQREWRSRAEVAARAAGVRAILPLIVCFLPAFFLVGVLPVIASVAGSVLS